MKNVIIAAILAGIVVFIWGSLSWTVLPTHKNEVKSIPEEVLNIDKMLELMPDGGLYHYPGFPSEAELEADKDAAMAKMMEKYKSGPLLSYVTYIPNGINGMDPMQFIYYLLINIVAGFIASFIVFMSAEKLVNYWHRFMFVVLMAVFAALIGPITNWNWWYIPTYTTMMSVLDFVVAWSFAGLVIAWRIKPNLVEVEQ